MRHMCICRCQSLSCHCDMLYEYVHMSSTHYVVTIIVSAVCRLDTSQTLKGNDETWSPGFGTYEVRVYLCRTQLLHVLARRRSPGLTIRHNGRFSLLVRTCCQLWEDSDTPPVLKQTEFHFRSEQNPAAHGQLIIQARRQFRHCNTSQRARLPNMQGMAASCD